MVTITNLSKKYYMGKNNVVDALRGLNCDIKEGEVWAVVGPSGSGKSTFLNILGGLDRKYDGEVVIDGNDIKEYDENYYRRFVVGTIFQQFYLIPALTVEENIYLPITFGKQMGKRKAKARLEYLLDKIGLKDRRHHKPSELSGGQAQRVAIARALMTEPKILLADEPTGNLDSKTGENILKLLLELNKEEKTTLIVVTHDAELGKKLPHKIELLDGKVKNV